MAILPTLQFGQSMIFCHEDETALLLSIQIKMRRAVTGVLVKNHLATSEAAYHTTKVFLENMVTVRVHADSIYLILNLIITAAIVFSDVRKHFIRLKDAQVDQAFTILHASKINLRRETVEVLAMRSER